jgi:RNA polymerase sigma factor (sigma-70 family)
MTNSLSLPTALPTTAIVRRALLTNREQALTQLYRQAFPAVRRYINRHGGSEEDAQDIFQDALVIFYEQTVGGTLTLTAAPSTYLVSISRNLWHHEQRRRARLPHEALPDNLEPLDTGEPEESAFAVLDYVERLGAKCKDVLLAFYYFQQPLTQIAEANGYASIRSATVQKFKCLERLRNSVRKAFAAETIE